MKFTWVLLCLVAQAAIAAEPVDPCRSAGDSQDSVRSAPVAPCRAAGASRDSLRSAAVAEVVDKPAPLVDAAHAGDQGQVDAMLAGPGRPDVNQTSSDGTTALHWAVYRNDVELVNRLLRAGANPNARNDYGSTPLAEAAVVGNVEVIKRLLKSGANAESPNGDGQTALMIVARSSNLEAAKLLLDHGADVNARERWRGQTALMWAVAENQPQMVRLLIKHHANVNERSDLTHFERQVTSEPRMQARPSGGFTPLLYAARRGCLDCAKFLVEGGADVNLSDPDGVAPLLLATENLNFDIAAELIKRGAEVDKWDRWGRSALYAAVDMNTLPVGGRADRPSSSATSALQLIDMLLKAGANPNLQLKLFPPYRSLRDDRGADSLLTVGATALLRAAKAGDIEAMRLLLAHGANPSLPTANGITPLMAAAGNGSAGLDTRGRYKTQAQAVEAVNLLLAAGVNINDRDRNGQTALYGAAQWGWNDLVKTLAARNADLTVKDSRGRTAADIAMGNSGGASGRASVEPHPETAALLRQLMADARPPVAGNLPGAQ